MGSPQTLTLLNELRATLGKMEVALGAISEAIVWTDEQGSVQWCNRAFDLLVGRPHIGVLGGSLLELLPLREAGEPVPPAAHPLRRCLRDAALVEERYELGGGPARRTLRVSAARVEAGDQPTTAMIVIRDVTEEARADEAARREAVFVRLLQEVATAANEAGSSEAALHAAVDRVCALTRWPIGHVYVVAEHDRDLLVPTDIWHLDDTSAFAEFREVTNASPLSRGRGLPGRVLATGEAAWITDIAVDSNFPRSALLTRLCVKSGFGFPVRAGAEIAAVLEFFSERCEQPDRDLLSVMEHIGHQLGRVVERKRIERDSEDARRAALDVARLKSDFLATMSHEIRTPLNGVIGATGLMLDSGLADEQRELAELAHSSAEILLGIVNDILDFSKIESGKLSIEPIPFDIEVAVGEVADLLPVNTEDKSLDLNVRFSPRMPRHVVGDPGRIRQVLTNLASNAIKFTARGHVLIEVTCEEIADGRGRFRFSVTDTGIGIPSDKQSTLFEKFTQADASTTRRYGGTGLGLAICRQLVELMGGRIGFESEEGRGSKFWFTLSLPLASVDVALPEPADELRDIRVLIVDDGETNCIVLGEQVASWGMRHTATDSAAAALQLMHAASAVGEPFQVALIDQYMPGMDGETLARAIKRDAELRGTVLLLLTSAGHRGDAARMAEAGFAAYLTKPVRPSLLLDAVATAWSAREAPGAPLITRHSLRERDAAPAPRAPEDSATTGGRVLLAEDNIVNQKIARRMLENLGCRVDVAANGKEVIDLVKRLPYDVIFMDCQMPEMDGYEATAEIRRRESADARVPIVALTAHALTGDLEKCLSAGMDGYVQKPVSRDMLRKALERWRRPHVSGAAPQPGPQL